MTFEEADTILYTVKAIKDAEQLDNRIHSLYKQKMYEEITRIALELNSELQRVYEDKLSSFPSLKKG